MELKLPFFLVTRMLGGAQGVLKSFVASSLSISFTSLSPNEEGHMRCEG